jgi:hypothetical protein
MNKSKLFAAAIVLLTAAIVPNLAEARHRYGYHSWYSLPYPISYVHNYGPGQASGAFAFYDGPSSNYCYQGAAGYLGQNGRRYPCF